MNARRNAMPVAVAAFLAAAFLGGQTPARAACPYYGIDTLATYAVVANPSIVLTSQSQPVWSAFAIRPAAGEDWDVTLFQNADADPTCVINALASSSAGGSIVDFVIGDYGFDPAGTYYTRCNRFSGAGNALVRWRESPQVMTVNAPAVSRSWNGLDVIETWNVQLVAGNTYTINFGVAGGMDGKVMLFRNPAASTYWSGRGGAVLTSSVTTTYLAPSSGTYAVVVVNDNGGAGNFALGIGTCTTPVTLASGTSIHTDLGYGYHSFNQTSAYWTAVGVRSNTADYDVSTWGGTAGSWPSCFSDAKGSSGGVGVVDFVVGDFNHNPLSTYYGYTLDYSAATGADVEWDSGADLLLVDGTAISRTSTSSDVLEVWDVLLTAGQAYNFAFNSTSSNLHMLLFRNTGGGVYWSGRSGAQFDVTGCQTYTAPSSGYYGVVVVNETGGGASYTLGVSKSPCACSTALATNVPASVPNPDGYYTFTQDTPFWGVVATRGATNADDWDLNVASSATGSPAPACLGGPLVASSYGAGLVDLGVIDFNHTPLGTYFARSHHFSGVAPTGVVEWNRSMGQLLHNGPYRSGSMTSNDLVHVWDAYMVAGTSYVIDYAPSDVTIKLLIFENAGGGSYFATRASAALLTSGGTTYTPTVTGYHGFVIANDQALFGSYSVQYGSCNAPTALVNDATVTAPEGLTSYSFLQHGNRWGAVGIRSVFSDWDIHTSATLSSPFPNCVGGALGSSTSGAIPFVDFVTGDFFHNPPGTYYVEAKQFTAGPLYTAPVEWSEGGGEVLVNDNNVTGGATDANNLLRSWNVYLSAGLQYTFAFNHAGAANLHLLLFQNAGGGVYWVGRSGAALDLTPGGGPFNYVAPSTGEYGIVVVNDDGANDSYSFNIKACFGPSALVSGVVTLDLPENFHSFTQAVPYWTAVGVRSTSDWDIVVNSNPGGGLPGVCQSGMLANSTYGLVPFVDFVVGDFNAGGNASGTYYTRPYRFSGTGIGSVEWDSGSDRLNVGAPPVHRTTDASDVLEVWDVFLNAGQTYGVYFAHIGAADVKVLIFRNPGGAYWAARGNSVFQSATHADFLAPATGWYGVVVVNDNGAVGDYDVGFSPTPLAVGGGGSPRVTALGSVQPNPARAQMTIAYTLSARAAVRLQMIDVAGRVVADVESGTRDAGAWRAAWNGRTNSGAKASPGVYLAKLEVDGRAIGERKVTVLE